MPCPSCGKSIDSQAAYCRHCGVAVSEIKSQLVAEGYAAPSGFREAADTSYPAESPSPQEQKSNIFSRLGGIVISLVAIVLVYAAVNGVLWAGQEAFYHEDNAKLEQMKSEMDKLDAKIKSFESSASAYGASKQAITVYEADIDRYNTLVDEYNALAKDSGTRWYVVPIPTGKSH